MSPCVKGLGRLFMTLILSVFLTGSVVEANEKGEGTLCDAY